MEDETMLLTLEGVVKTDWVETNGLPSTYIPRGLELSDCVLHPVAKQNIMTMDATREAMSAIVTLFDITVSGVVLSRFPVISVLACGFPVDRSVGCRYNHRLLV